VTHKASACTARSTTQRPGGTNWAEPGVCRE
jgi:hypothetical protein